MSAIDVISVLGTGISAISFLQSFLPDHQTYGATVMIRTSKGYNPSTGEMASENTGGRVRDVYGYDAGGRLLGDSGGGKIDAGDKTTFKINQGNQDQSLYIDVVADDDAVCIPVIGVTQPGDGQNYGWVGDVFNACGLENYYGNVDVDGQGYMPRCGWIDANHEDNVNAGSFKWYLPAFSVGHGNKNYNTDVDYYCHPRPFEVRYDAQPIEKRSESQAKERRERIRRDLKTKELILSPHAQHPASELCEDPTTVGPDFVSLHEKTFCDMGNKKWYKLCDDESGILDDCFALDIVNRTMSGQFTHPKAFSLASELVQYEAMTQWY